MSSSESQMIAGFSGEPLARWDGERNMILEEDFHYVDPRGRQWRAPKGSFLNGATIPRALWSAVGSPYAGKYRRASVVHDVAVGELGNPEVTKAERKRADRMFYDACRSDGCSRRFAATLYIGVRFGSWLSKRQSTLAAVDLEGEEIIRDDRHAAHTVSTFWALVDASEDLFEAENLDAIDEMMESEMGD